MMPWQQKILARRAAATVLEMFHPGDRHRLGAAGEQEPERLLTERGLPPSLARGADLPHLDCGSFAAPPGARPETVGRQVAAAIFGGVNPRGNKV